MALIFDKLPTLADTQGESLQAKFHNFKPLLLQILQEADPTDPYGVVGAFLSPAEFVAYQDLPAGQNAEVWTRQVRPNDLAADATSAEQLIFKIAFKVAEKERDTLILCQHALHQKLPLFIQEQFIHAATLSFRFGSPQEQYAKIKTLIGPLTYDHIALETAKLKTPYRVGTTIEEYFHSLDRGFRFRASVGYPISALEQMATALGTLTEAGIFDRTIRHFYESHPDLADQTYANLKTIFLADAPRDLQSLKHAATASAATSANSPLEKEVLELKAQVLALSSKLADTKPKQKSKSSDQRPHNHFCWTCGPQQGHPSYKCPTPAEGHQPGATKANKMGSRHT